MNTLSRTCFSNIDCLRIIFKTVETVSKTNENESAFEMEHFTSQIHGTLFHDCYGYRKAYLGFLLAPNGLNCWLSPCLSEVTAPPPVRACSELAH